jgi:hypothetical protein
MSAAGDDRNFILQTHGPPLLCMRRSSPGTKNVHPAVFWRQGRHPEWQVAGAFLSDRTAGGYRALEERFPRDPRRRVRWFGRKGHGNGTWSVPAGLWPTCLPRRREAWRPGSAHRQVARVPKGHCRLNPAVSVGRCVHQMSPVLTFTDATGSGGGICGFFVPSTWRLSCLQCCEVAPGLVGGQGP